MIAKVLLGTLLTAGGFGLYLAWAYSMLWFFSESN